MKTSLTRAQAQEAINKFFNKPSFTKEELKKIKRIAMKFNIKLGNYRKLFCKKCLSQLKGRIRITKTHKTITCEKCSHKNRFKVN